MHPGLHPRVRTCLYAHVLAPEKLIDGKMNDFINLFIGTDFSVIETIQKSSSTKWYRTDNNSYWPISNTTDSEKGASFCEDTRNYQTSVHEQRLD